MNTSILRHKRVAKQLLIFKYGNLFAVAVLSLMYLVVTPRFSNAQTSTSSIVQSKNPSAKKEAIEPIVSKNIKSGIKGIVAEYKKNEPIAGAAVILYDMRKNIIARTYTDTKGHFIFGNLKHGRYNITVAPTGYDSLESQVIGVKKNKFTTVNFYLSRGHFMGRMDVIVIYPGVPFHYFIKHPWKYIKGKIFKIDQS